MGDVNFTRIWGQCFKIYTKIRLGSSFPNAEEDEKFAFGDTEMIVISRDLWVHLLLMFGFVSQIIHICTKSDENKFINALLCKIEL